MKQMRLLFSNEVELEDNKKMKLDYILTEVSGMGSTKPYYGIHITKCQDDMIEADEINGISYSKEKVVSMIEKLYKYEVTPISMVEIIDDLVTLES